MMPTLPALDTIDDFIAELTQRGVELTADNHVLRVSAPKGVVDAALAAEIASRKPGILRRLEARPTRESTAIIARAERAGPMALGFVQKRMWLHDQMESDSALYNLPAAWRLRGPIELDEFLQAFDAVVERHEILRVSIRAGEGEPTQVFDSAGSHRLETEDLSTIAVADRERTLAARIKSLRDEIIDLESGPPFLARLFRLAPDEHVLFLMPHHVVWDGWSFDIFLRDLGELYGAGTSGRRAVLPEMPIQYADYAVWHERWLRGGAMQRQLAYWEDALAGELPPLDLPLDFPRPKHFSHAGDWEEFTLSEATMARINRLAGKHRATSFIVLLAAWGGFLHRMSGQGDIVVGVPIQARQVPEVTDVIGCFVNTLCVRLRFDPVASFERLVEDVRATSLGAYEHQDTPVDMLVDRFANRRDTGRTPLFQTMFSHQQVSRRPENLGELRLSQEHVNPGATPTDLMLAVMEGGAAARGVILYSTSLFTATTIRQLRLRFEHFLDAALSDPSECIEELHVVTPEERDLVVTQWNDTAREVSPCSTVSELLGPRSWSRLQAPALRFDGRAMTYAELDSRSNRLARLLRSKGVSRGALVGLCVERSAEMVVALSAILRAGAAYVPLDPAYPPDRLDFMARDAGLALLVTESALAPILGWPSEQSVRLDGDRDVIASQPDVALEPDGALDARPEDPAYVIYTSGSTGNPKGVVVPHRAVVNFLGSMATEPGISSADRLLAVTTLSFDIAVLELLLPLSVGAEVILASRDEAMDGDALGALLESSGATVMQATPSTWRLLVDAGWQGTKDLRILVGGEGLQPDLARDLLQRSALVWNMYGPTETTVWSTCWRVHHPEKRISIGRPIANTQVYVLDERSQLCPPGVPGEICIGGHGVALGYLNQPALTAGRFVVDPFAGTQGRLLYRTGDRGRWLSDGTLEHLGRRDCQVKVRGHRIELGEIELQLAAHPGVANALALVREDRPGDARLVAYVVPSAGDRAQEHELRLALKAALPDYMVPQHFVVMAAMPLLPNGKIDRQALPAPTMLRVSPLPVQEFTSLEPRTIYLMAVWKEMLGAEATPDDNFFDLGGHSMLAVQMATRVSRDTGVRIKLMRLATQTLAQIAAELPAGSGLKPLSSGMGSRITMGLKRLFQSGER